MMAVSQSALAISERSRQPHWSIYPAADTTRFDVLKNAYRPRSAQAPCRRREGGPLNAFRRVAQRRPAARASEISGPGDRCFHDCPRRRPGRTHVRRPASCCPNGEPAPEPIWDGRLGFRPRRPPLRPCDVEQPDFIVTPALRAWPLDRLRNPAFSFAGYEAERRRCSEIIGLRAPLQRVERPANGLVE